MRRLILFLVVFSASLELTAQFRRAEPVEPPFYIYKGSEYGRLMVRNKATPEYFYYEAKEDGSLRFPRWRLTDYTETDSSQLYTSLPSGWAKYYLPCQLESGTLLAYWSPADGVSYPLYYLIVDGDTILAQGNGVRPVEDYFVHRGKNLLYYSGITTVIDLDSVCYASFSYGETGLGGLYEPDGYATPAGYTLYYDEDSTKIYSTVGFSGGDTEAGTNLIAAISYTPSLSINTFNLGQFPDITVPDYLHMGFGQGAPYYSEIQATTPQMPLKKGWTQTQSGALVSPAKVPDANISAFFDATGKWAEVAAGLSGQYPSLAGVIDDPSPTLTGIPAAAAFALGANTFYNKYNYYDPVTDSPTGVRKKGGNWLWDEEEWYFPSGREVFLKDVFRGMTEGMTNVFGDGGRIIMYGWQYAPTAFLRGEVSPYPEGRTVAEADAFTNSFALGYMSWPHMYFDNNVEYYKSPVGDTVSYYIKSAGEYVLDGLGRRQFRTDRYYDMLFGDTTWFEPEPTAYFVSVNSEYAPDSSQPFIANIPLPENVRPDANKAVYQQYRLHDRIQTAMVARANALGGGDATRYHEVWPKPSAILSFGTEPFTYGGNSHEGRQIGKAGVMGQVVMQMMGGGLGYETWEDGTGGEIPVGDPLSTFQTAPASGNQIYGEDDYYSKFEAATAANQAVIAAFDGMTLNSNFRYFHWSKYVESAQKKEIIGGGFYQGDQLSAYFIYPFHDQTDTTEITVYLGDNIIKTVQLVGRLPAIYRWEIDNSVTPQSLVIEYTNIDGNQVRVNGDIKNRYDSNVGNPPIVDSGEPAADNFAANESIGDIGYRYGADYLSLRSELSSGVAKFNYYGNPSPNNAYPALQDLRTAPDGNLVCYDADNVMVDWPSHSYSGITFNKVGKVHYKVFDSNDNLVLEVYDTRGGWINARGNNHPDNCLRWLKRGVYRIWVKNISTDGSIINLVFGTNQLPTRILDMSLGQGQEHQFSVNLQQPESNDAYAYKMNINVSNNN